MATKLEENKWFWIAGGIGVIVILVLGYLALTGSIQLGKDRQYFSVWKGNSSVDLLAVEVNQGFYREATLTFNDEYVCKLEKLKPHKTYFVNIHNCPHKEYGTNYIEDIDGVEIVVIEAKKIKEEFVFD